MTSNTRQHRAVHLIAPVAITPKTMTPFEPAHLLANWSALATPPPPRLWIAYSGGLDSHVLLHAAAQLRSALPPLSAVHINHGLHPAASAWAAHCQQMCAALTIPLHIQPVNVQRGGGVSPEAAARAARYAAWAQLLQPDEQLATAHHADDQAETLLLALLRGSGVAGLAAMPTRRPLAAGWLIRPLLSWPRSALLDYAQRQRLRWIDDPSNANPDYDRNFLRHRVLPTVRERWPSAAHTINRSAAHCADIRDWLAEQSAADCARVAGSRPNSLSINGLQQLPLPTRRHVLRHWLTKCGFLPPNHAYLQRLATEMLTSRPDANPQVYWPGGEVRRYRDDLFALRPLPPRPPAVIAWPDVTQPLALPAELGYLTAAPALRNHAPIQVQFATPGIRCYLPNQPPRTLKYLFQTAAIPPWIRGYIPLICNQHGLISVAGLTQCQAGAVIINWHGHPWEAIGWFIDNSHLTFDQT